eukprot:403356003
MNSQVVKPFKNCLSSRGYQFGVSAKPPQQSQRQNYKNRGKLQIPPKIEEKDAEQLPSTRRKHLYTSQFAKPTTDSNHQLLYKYEIRAFDGRLNETKDQAMRFFENRYGFKPLPEKSQTPGILTNLNNYFSNMGLDPQKNNDQQLLSNSHQDDSTSSKQDAQNNQNQDPNEASQNMNDKHLNSEETSLLNSSYADFHDVFKNLKKRQEQMKHKKHNDSIMFRGADLSTTLHDRSLDYLGGGQSILPHSVKNDSSIMHNYSAQGVSKMSQNSGTKNTQKNLLINRLAYKLLSQQKQRPLSLVNQNNPYNSLFGNPNNQHNNSVMFSQSGQIQHNHSQIGKRHDLELSNIVKSCVQNVSSSRFLNKQNKLGQINNQIQHQGYDLKDPLMIGHNLKGSLTQNSSFEHLNGNQQIRSNMPTSTFHRVEKTRKLSNQTDDLPHLNLKSRSQQQQLLQEQNENLDDNEDPKQTQREEQKEIAKLNYFQQQSQS